MPPSPSDEPLARARELSAAISTATDALNASLQRAQQALTELNLGVTAAVPLYPQMSHAESHLDWRQFIRFGKDASGWRLILESGHEGQDPEDWSESPLLNASKEVRLQAVVRLPALLEQLVETAEAHLTSLKERAAEADAFASTVAKRKA
ncbi:MAG: hypothetical protein ABI134_18375 [Byssovorax sp.]